MELKLTHPEVLAHVTSDLLAAAAYLCQAPGADECDSDAMYDDVFTALKSADVARIVDACDTLAEACDNVPHYHAARCAAWLQRLTA